MVVAIVSDTTTAGATAEHLEACLAALEAQVNAPPFEIIVPHRVDVVGLERVRERFPTVRFLPVPDVRVATDRAGSREHHDALRARGLAVARGRLIALLEDVGRPDRNWCAAFHDRHREDWAGVGGAIENGVDRPLNWAVSYCDFGRYQNPVPDGPSSIASDANVCYKREALESSRPVWRDSFHETTVNGALLAAGRRLTLASEAVVRQHRVDLTFGAALRERFVWGRSYAATRAEMLSPGRRLVYTGLTPLLPVVLTLRMWGNLRRKGRGAGPFLRALPLIVVLTAAWSAGEAAGYITCRA